MSATWITNCSNRVEPVINPLAGACLEGYIPDDIHLLQNPDVSDVAEAATSLMKTIVTAAGGDEPTVTAHSIEEETDFDAIVGYLSSTIRDAQSSNAEVAVDITPGRKFWSFISFQSGLRHGVDHLYYVHLHERYFGESFPTIPRTAIDLIDFTEELDADQA